MGWDYSTGAGLLGLLGGPSAFLRDESNPRVIARRDLVNPLRLTGTGVCVCPSIHRVSAPKALSIARRLDGPAFTRGLGLGGRQQRGERLVALEQEGDAPGAAAEPRQLAPCRC